jgi:hypothetical protein
VPTENWIVVCFWRLVTVGTASDGEGGRGCRGVVDMVGGIEGGGRVAKQFRKVD